MIDREFFKQITRQLVHPDDTDNYYLSLKSYSLTEGYFQDPDRGEIRAQIEWMENNLNCGIKESFSAEKETQSFSTKSRLTPEQVTEEIDKVIQQEYEESQLTAVLNYLSPQFGWTLKDLTTFYERRRAFLEEEDFAQDVADEVRTLTAIARRDIDLNDYLYPQLATALQTFSRNLNCKRSIVLLTLLTACSACVKTGTRILCDRRKNWTQPASLYSLMISPSGQGKSPIHDQLLQIPFWRIQSEWREEWERAVEAYEMEMLEAKAAKPEDRVAILKGIQRPPEQQRVLFASDPTIIGLVNQFRVWPKQPILGLFDEGRKLFSFDRTPASGSDRSDLLAFYNGYGVLELRKDGVRNAVPELSLSILGTIQPDVLFDLMSDPNDSDGQWARFQFCIQPLTRKTPAVDLLAIDLEEYMVWLYTQLLNLEKEIYYFSDEAQLLFDAYVYGEIEDLRMSSTVPALQSLYGKAGGQVGRIALNLHLIKRCFASIIGQEREVSQETVQSAIAFNRFTIQQTKLLYSQAQINNDELPPKLAMIYQLSKQVGGITARDVRNYRRAFRKEESVTIRQWFRKLVGMGLGRVEGINSRLRFIAH